jgi:hypothetical protein
MARSLGQFLGLGRILAQGLTRFHSRVNIWPYFRRVDAGLPLLPALFHPHHWFMWLGLAFALAVYFAPTGIVGALKRNEVKEYYADRLGS